MIHPNDFGDNMEIHEIYIRTESGFENKPYNRLGDIKTYSIRVRFPRLDCVDVVFHTMSEMFGDGPYAITKSYEALNASEEDVTSITRNPHLFITEFSDDSDIIVGDSKFKLCSVNYGKVEENERQS